MNKSEARKQVWEKLIKVARPDSRYHFDFNEYIPDFEGSDLATNRIRALPLYQSADTIFITPDNCLEELREKTMLDGKLQVVSTYGISRGMVLLEAGIVPDEIVPYVVMLDAMEEAGRYISLREMQREGTRFDLLVTGASAVNTRGVRFGKGHGFFDLEWAMLYAVGAVTEETPVVAFVHDCQVVDLDFEISPFDSVCDLIITPTRTIEISDPQKPTQGVIWEKLEPGMMENIPLLQELKEMESSV